jgi:hypothetical protein
MLRRVVFEEVCSFLFLEDLEALRVALGHPRGSRGVENHAPNIGNWCHHLDSVISIEMAR